MKPSFQIVMGQQLAMTPQLQQAIRLLQLSTLDLQQEIQEVLESNPMLEVVDTRQTSSGENQLLEGEQPPDFNEKEQQEVSKEDAEWSEGIPFELSVDSKWDDIYTNLPPSPDEDSNFQDRSVAVETLQDHLEWQLNLTPMSDKDRLIGLTIIESVSSEGYLTSTIDDIFLTLSEQIDDLDRDEVVVMQHRIQRFDPIGCSSEDLKQCLQVQLLQQQVSDDERKTAQILIDNHLNALGSHDYVSIMKKMRLKEAQLSQALKLIQSLNPRPGAEIEQPAAEYIIPDITVKKYMHVWHAELNSSALPKLGINSTYAALVQRANNSRDNTFMKNHLQEARWFLKNVQNRNETLLKVAKKIVEYQQQFFTDGEQAMKPLVLSDIAEAIGMHESTISRVTTQKYMNTPKGIFELKYFFSSHVNTAEGGECSSTAIRALIKQMVAEESVRKPLSDNKLSLLLGGQGINVARRTVAKYRESMNIPPSNERKRLA